MEIRTGFLPANKTANRFPCQDHIERAKKHRYSHPAFLCAHGNHMHSTVFNAGIRNSFVSSKRINLAALGPDLEEGGNVVVSLVFVPRADDACFVPGDYADTQANGLGARKDAGGGRRACICCVNTRLGFCPLSCAASADYIYIL